MAQDSVMLKGETASCTTWNKLIKIFCWSLNRLVFRASKIPL